MEPRRHSIFKIVLTRVFIIVLLFNILLAAVNIYDINSLQRSSDEKLKQQIKEEIVNISRFQTSALESLAKTLVNMQSEALYKLYELHKKSDLKNLDLNKHFSMLRLDSTFNAVYIIENGVIVNTTFPTDHGLNFYNLGQDYRNFLLDILEGDKIYNLGFDFEYRTKKLRAYSYLPTHDKEYLIEIGSYSEIANEIMQMLKKRLKEVVDQNENIVSMNLWVSNQGEEFSLIDDSLNVFVLHRSVSYVFSKKTSFSAKFNIDELKLRGEFIYLDMEEDSLIPELIVSIITDETDKNKPILKIIRKQFIFTLFFLLLIIIVIVLATNKIKKVFSELMQKASLISKGDLSERLNVEGNNELTTLAEQFNSMVQKLEESYNDLNMTNNLIRDNMKLLQQQTDDIVESITYAQRIQKAALPDDEILDEMIPDRFIIYRPKDMVSGDFYWAKKIKNFNIIVAADCTGHGIPGAFMSMLGMSILNEIVSKSRVDTAGETLTRLRKKLKKILHQTTKGGDKANDGASGTSLGNIKDGMDLAMCIIDTETNIMQFAGAFNPVYVYRKKELIEIKGDRMPVGVYIAEKPEFTNHEIQLEPGDAVFIFSDGFADQIGGPDNKKFMVMNLKQLLMNNSDKPMEEQSKIYEKTLTSWMKEQEQIDDILMLGFRIN